ncbi:hypothetical protein Patl1_21120 [Pistacia atlantica]|uniref:Uncharacterized protein n=1 Tax=Pistacia atlantica TaxID=434234 RepID=A0ACC1BN22_9ROSI|nr:hypothetical protein Patl1_21120 [Pistacia atlantica]
MADIHDSVSGTNHDEFVNDELFYSLLAAADSHEIENQGDHDPLCSKQLPLLNLEGISASTSIMDVNEADWDWPHPSQPGNTSLCSPALGSEGDNNVELVRNHQQEIQNLEMENSNQYIPSRDIPILSLENDDNDVMSSEYSGGGGLTISTKLMLKKQGFRMQKQANKDTKLSEKRDQNRTFLEAMGNRQPKIIFTDGCQALSDALEVVLPDTKHLLGLRYIFQNTAEHLSSYSGQTDFDSLFNKCIFDCASEEEFESMWGSLLEQYNLYENSWLKDLYALRGKWSQYTCKSIFSAGMRSPQGYESFCKILQNWTNETMTPLKFIQKYLKIAEQQRKEELYEDFHCHGSAATTILRSNAMEKEAAKIYTSAIFKIFQAELLECLSVAVEEIPSDGMKTIFKLTEGDPRKEKIVEFNSSESHVICSCKKYESVGILCVHALKVLNARNIFHIPPQYILKRWTKSAKDGMVADCHEAEVPAESQRHLHPLKSKLMHNALDVITKSLANEGTWMIVDNHLKMALRKVEDALRTKNIGHLNTIDVDVHCNDDAVSANHIDCTESEQTIASPSRINRQEVSKNIMKCQLKRKYENEVREMNWGGCQGSRKGASRSYCIGENSRQSACKSPRPPLPSQSTFHQIRQPSKSMGNIQDTKKHGLHLLANRTAAAEKKIMVIMEQLQKEMLKFRHENQKIFNSLNVVDSCYNQTTKKNKFICQEKSALQHEFQGIGSDKAQDLDADEFV